MVPGNFFNFLIAYFKWHSFANGISLRLFLTWGKGLSNCVFIEDSLIPVPFFNGMFLQHWKLPYCQYRGMGCQKLRLNMLLELGMLRISGRPAGKFGLFDIRPDTGFGLPDTGKREIA
jgi:hypothetical protein